MDRSWHIVFALSVCMLLRLSATMSVCPQKSFNIGHKFSIVSDQLSYFTTVFLWVRDSFGTNVKVICQG